MQERTALDEQLTALGRMEQELDDQVTLIELGESENDPKTIVRNPEPRKIHPDYN